MRLGLIVSPTDRGLGQQTWELWRHLQPAVTVCIDASPIPTRTVFPQHFDRFPGAYITPWKGYTAPISDEALLVLLTCDVIFTVETWYDPRLPEMARNAEVATVIYVNPELWRDHETEHVSAVWVPTKWRIDQIPKAEHVPMPVALDRFTEVQPGERFLHVGGHKARADRNGTETAIRAARYANIDLTVTTQDRVRMAGRNVYQPAPVENYWQLYQDHGVLVMPRKYGGLCLPVQEAMAAGLAVVMSDVEPNQDWPVALVKGQIANKVTMAGGVIPIFETDRVALAEEMKRMLEPDYRREWQTKSRAWAKAHSWQMLRAEWLARLAEVC